MAMRRRASGLVLIIVVAGLLVLASLGHGLFPGAVPTPGDADKQYAVLRQQMVHDGIIGWGIESPEVIRAMGTVPRHAFVPVEYLDQAYENHPLPIGHGQTISQPYIVALMTEALDLQPGEKVLEIGTGSGYQAAVLAECGAEVYSIEIIGALADEARAHLKATGYDRVHVRHADGYWGWPEEAPFDGIIVTAAPDHVPQPLLDQLKSGGILVIPIGPPGGYQELWRIERQANGDISSISLGGVRFVPLTRSD
jgi:protein-L-isoaspartate(D-aspartate) O-methyltransferase